VPGYFNKKAKPFYTFDTKGAELLLERQELALIRRGRFGNKVKETPCNNGRKQNVIFRQASWSAEVALKCCEVSVFMWLGLSLYRFCAHRQRNFPV
jgi:hypothetical protein